MNENDINIKIESFIRREIYFNYKLCKFISLGEEYFYLHILVKYLKFYSPRGKT